MRKSAESENTVLGERGATLDGKRFDLRALLRPNILELEPYRCAREKVLEGILLDANENPYPVERGGVSLNRYPDPYQRRLRRALAAELSVEPDWVLAGAGSDEVIDWIFKAFCQPGGDRVATAEPTYGLYRVAAQIFGVELFDFRLNEDLDFDARRFLEAVPPAVKVLFLCSPNNPTGNFLNRDEILKLCRRWDRIVVVDEAYVEFSGTPSLVIELRQNPNLIVMRTFSKALGRAGLRLGYAVASPEIIGYFLKVKAPYNLGAMALEEGLQALGQGETRRRQIRQICRERERLAAALEELPGVARVFPSAANFLLFRCRKGASEICRRLLEKGIVVRDRSTLPGLENCLRVSVGTPPENDLFLRELGRIMEAMSNQS